MKWIPESPIKSDLQTRLIIHKFPRDYYLNFDASRIPPRSYVEGVDAFKQRFTKTLLTSPTPIYDPNFPLLDYIPKSKNQEIFNKECERISLAIVNQKLSDSTPESPSGLGHTVEQINSITNQDNTLIFEMLVTGIEEPFIIEFPLTLLQR